MNFTYSVYKGVDYIIENTWAGYQSYGLQI